MPRSEIIIADWGSEVPLSNRLSEIFVDRPHWLSNCPVYCLTIPPSVTSKFDTPFSEPHALNCAIRHAQGDWIGRIDQDTLVGDGFAEWWNNNKFEAGLEILFAQAHFSGRRDMPEGQFVPSPNDPINPDCINGQEFYRGAVGIILAPTRTWRAIRGWDERLIQRLHAEHDLCIRLRNEIGLHDLGKDLGYPFHHQWHPRCSDRKLNESQTTAHLESLFKYNTVVNPKNWGLADYDKEIVKVRI
jgi:hypothetical protein